jgi:hypothetical protein
MCENKNNSERLRYFRKEMFEREIAEIILERIYKTDMIL